MSDVIYSNSVNTVYPIDRTKAIQCIANSTENDSRISETLYRESKKEQSFTLSWSHYLVLMRIKNEEERRFYEVECLRQDWSVRQLKREYGASLYERLALESNVLYLLLSPSIFILIILHSSFFIIRIRASTRLHFNPYLLIR